LTVRCRTRLPLEHIEAWLEENCPGGWDIVISGIFEDESGAVWKHLEVVFAAVDECTRFRGHLARSA
jgi:hypothetical protein